MQEPEVVGNGVTVSYEAFVQRVREGECMHRSGVRQNLS